MPGTLRYLVHAVSDPARVTVVPESPDVTVMELADDPYEGALALAGQLDLAELIDLQRHVGVLVKRRQMTEGKADAVKLYEPAAESPGA